MKNIKGKQDEIGEDTYGKRCKCLEEELQKSNAKRGRAWGARYQIELEMRGKVSNNPQSTSDQNNLSEEEKEFVKYLWQKHFVPLIEKDQLFPRRTGYY